MSEPSAFSTAFSNITGLSGGKKTVTTGGVRERITAAETPCAGVIIQALRSNNGNVQVGGSDVDGTIGSENGVSLVPGQPITYPCKDLSMVWIDADNDDEGISYSLLHG